MICYSDVTFFWTLMKIFWSLKMSENSEMQETILLLRQQLDSLLSEKSSTCQQQDAYHDAATLAMYSDEYTEAKLEREAGVCSYEERIPNESTQTSIMISNERLVHEVPNECSIDAFLNSQLLSQVGFPLIFCFWCNFYKYNIFHVFLFVGCWDRVPETREGANCWGEGRVRNSPSKASWGSFLCKRAGSSSSSWAPKLSWRGNKALLPQCQTRCWKRCPLQK